MLEPHAVPAGCRYLLLFLLQPAIWKQKGNVLGLLNDRRLLGGRCAAGRGSLGYHLEVMYTIKINDGWGMELPQAVMQDISQ